MDRFYETLQHHENHLPAAPWVKRDTVHQDPQPSGSLPIVERAVAGVISGLAATVVMDAVGTLIWERATPDTAKHAEREVEPDFPLAVLAGRISPKHKESLASLFHWGVGAFCGALYGMLEEKLPVGRLTLGQSFAGAMLAVDEFGFSAAGLTAWPDAFPWQTHARATLAHATYGAGLAAAYGGMKTAMLAARGLGRPSEHRFHR